ncbi:endonuclease/exonuclease/phosphatase family protein [Galbibacter sp.]|jgi:endonuclease/exonuclease/phosphatase family metal-dependent hydrolase|uniref:endonuclease/exonuclease/phosphatase family protein n=1 Tax=Galbibacter sp. TaxID=2918471 RepID=UPI003A8F5BAE
MKKLSWAHKFVFSINIVVAVLLILGYASAYIPVKSFPRISIYSLITPVLIVVNIIFMLYWMVKIKRQFLLSFLILLIGYPKVSSLYKFSGTQEVVSNGTLKVMTYNVRVFNVYKWIKGEDVFGEIKSLIKEENPSILCFQEFYYTKEGMFNEFPYRYINYKTQETGQAIYSKFPIINKGSLEFPNSGNNAIFADIVCDSDTIRVYNIHLQSFHIDPESEEISQKNSSRLASRMGAVFSKQQVQTEIFVEHKNQSPYKTITCGDLNNNQYSAIYQQIKGNDLDSFEEQGEGTGKTFYFKYFPLRIDFIFMDPRLEVVSHKNRYEQLSDHYPVMTQLQL